MLVLVVLAHGKLGTDSSAPTGGLKLIHACLFHFQERQTSERRGGEGGSPNTKIDSFILLFWHALQAEHSRSGSGSAQHGAV